MRFALLAAVLPACMNTPEEARASYTDDEGDVVAELSDPFNLGCAATVNPKVVTIPSVTWHANGVSSYVEYGRDASYGMVTPVYAGTDLNIPLYGMPGVTDVYFHAVTELADGSVVDCSGVVTTGAVPAEIPRVVVDVNDGDWQGRGEYVFGVMFQPGQSPIPHFAGYNRDGELVWYASGDQNMVATDLQFALDGNDILYNEYAPDWSRDPIIRRITMGGDVVREVATPLGHHMFAQLPDGTLAYNALDPRLATDPDTLEVEWIVGDAIGEVSPDGTVSSVFSVWDWLTVTSDPVLGQPSMYPQGKDWTHGNAVKYDATTGHYLLSLAHTDTVIDIDRASGVPAQMYGTVGMPVASDSLAFNYQHDPSFTEEGNLLVFTTDNLLMASGAIEYEIVDGELHEVWSHGMDGDVYAPMLGQATRLASGNTMVNYGGGAQMEEVRPDGTVVWRARPDGQGAVFAQMRLVDDLYAGR